MYDCLPSRETVLVFFDKNSGDSLMDEVTENIDELSSFDDIEKLLSSDDIDDSSSLEMERWDKSSFDFEIFDTILELKNVE